MVAIFVGVNEMVFIYLFFFAAEDTRILYEKRKLFHDTNHKIFHYSIVYIAYPHISGRFS